MNDPVLVTNPSRPRDHGSGFVIRRLEGGAGVQVVTCAHVVRTLGADGLRVADLPAKVVIDLASQGIDLAVLAVEGLTEPVPYELARGAEGEEVELLGFEPAGGGPVAVPHRGRLAKASVTALAGRNRPAWHLELADGSIEGGHSGGPVVGARSGRVVGVIAMGPDQLGGKDGVAVAIENLRVWKDAPPIAAASRPLVSTSGTSSFDELLVKPWWSRQRRWIAIGAVSLAGAVGLAVAVVPRGTTPEPSACAIPDIRDSYADVAESAWCPDAITGETPCVERFDDGSVVAGYCRGTDAIGDWSSRDAAGVERWRVRFAEAGRHPTAVLTRTQRLSSGAEVRTEVRRGLESGSGPVDDWTQELSCKRDGGFASVTREKADSAKPDVEITLVVPQGALTCTTTAGATVCSIEEQSVSGKFADDTLKRLENAEKLVRACNLPDLPALAQCGDHKKSADEECDDGGVDTARCNLNCTLRRCGDRYINAAAGETCDTGGESPGCDDDCTVPVCGDANVNEASGEECEPQKTTRGLSDTRTCDADCTRPVCGDGRVNRLAGETCDPPDGKTCTPVCKKGTVRPVPGSP